MSGKHLPHFPAQSRPSGRVTSCSGSGVSGRAHRLSTAVGRGLQGAAGAARGASGVSGGESQGTLESLVLIAGPGSPWPTFHVCLSFSTALQRPPHCPWFTDENAGRKQRTEHWLRADTLSLHPACCLPASPQTLLILFLGTLLLKLSNSGRPKALSRTLP